MVFEAISATHHAGKGVSRQKIAAYIKANWDNIAEGAHFNAALRHALKDGIDRGVLVQGETIQRWKITDLGRKERGEQKLSKKYDIDEEEKKEKKAKAAKKKAADKKKKEAAASKAKKKKESASSSKKKKESKSSSSAKRASKKTTASARSKKPVKKVSTQKATRKSPRKTARKTRS